MYKQVENDSGSGDRQENHPPFKPLRMSAEADSTSLIHTGEENYIASKSEILCEKKLENNF